MSDLGVTLDHVEPLEVQMRGFSFGNGRINQESLGCVSCPKSTQVYTRRNHSLGLRLRDNGRNLSNNEDLGGVEATLDALLASLLNAQLDSFSAARVTAYDFAKFEAEINGQFSNDIGTFWALNHFVAVSGSSKCFAVNIFSNSIPPISPSP